MSNKQFVGFQNFINTLKNPMFQRGLSNTALFMGIGIPLLLGLSLFLALLLKKMPRGKSITALIFMVPMVIPSGTCAYFWKCIFDVNGLLNKFLYINGIRIVNWSNSEWSMVIAIILFIWKNIGFSAVIFWTSINRIPTEYYELAYSEGAGAWKQFRHVTAIYLMPTTFVVAILAFVNSFKIFKELYILYGNYPSQHIYMLQHYMNNQFFSFNMQKLTAAAYILFLLIGSLVFIMFHMQKKLSDTFNSLQLGGGHTYTKVMPIHRFVYPVVGVTALLISLPLMFTFANSLMSGVEVINRYTTKVTAYNQFDIAKDGLHFVRMGLIPDTATIQQYKELLLHNPVYLRLYWNSIIIVVPVVLGQCLVSCLSAYAFERIQWKHKEILFFLYIAIALMPLQVLLVPHYIVADWMGLSNNYLAIILPGIFSPFGVFWIRQQLKGFPGECIEAAQMCGASEWTIFRHIVLPNLKPAISTLVVLTFAEYWNVVDQALVFIKSPYKEPLSTYLSRIIEGNLVLFFAVSCFYLIPPLIIFLIGKDYFVDEFALSKRKK